MNFFRICICACLLPLPSAAQGTVQASPLPIFEHLPESLPPRVKGADVRSVVHALARLPKKDEFETTADYLRRLHIPDSAWVAVPLSAQVKYNADSAALVIEVTPDLIFGEWRLESITRQERFVRSTTNGIKFTAIRETMDVVGFSDMSPYGEPVRLDLPMPPDSARSVKPAVEVWGFVLLDYRPDEGWTREGRERSNRTPTPSFPKTLEVNSHLFFGRGVRVVAFDRRTRRRIGYLRSEVDDLIAAYSPDSAQEVGAPEAFFEYQVEQRATLVEDGSPAFPAALRQAGIMSGGVLAQFVVDSSGQAVASSFKVLYSTDDAFVAAVRGALPRMKFKPAEVGGRRVRQFFQHAFTFNLRE